MKIALLFFFFIVFSFVMGQISAKPKIITREETVKVYDFTQEPEMMKAYADMMGKVLIDYKEIVEIKKQAWLEGFENGQKNSAYTRNDYGRISLE